MKACRYYSPGKGLITTNQSVEMSELYEFDQPLLFSSCANRQVVGPSGYGACSYEREMTACPLYSAEEHRTLRSLVVDRGRSYNPRFERLQLITYRGVNGFREYAITSTVGYDNNWDEGYSVIHYVSSRTHGSGAHEVAESLLTSELESREGSRCREEEIPPAPQKRSYLETVLT